MMIEQDVLLKPYNSFGIDVKAKYFASFSSEEALLKVFAEKESMIPQANVLCIGSATNILFSDDFPGLIIKNNIGGITISDQDDEYCFITAGSGVLWSDLVDFCISKNFGGIENLSLIPGTVGAAPIQNIGAYGVEIKDILYSVRFLDLNEKRWMVLSNNDCDFGYRTSIFKQKLKGRVIITSVTFRLTKKHQLNLEYGAIRQNLDAKEISNPTIREVSDAVKNIRRSKLPDPKLIGNAGSFFKNPVISTKDHNDLIRLYPDVVANEIDGRYKIAAGWLIEKAGWKGYREGEVGCYPLQALVLVNYGSAKGSEILHLSRKIQQSVLKKFGILLEPEVNIV